MNLVEIFVFFCCCFFSSIVHEERFSGQQKKKSDDRRTKIPGMSFVFGLCSTRMQTIKTRIFITNLTRDI